MSNIKSWISYWAAAKMVAFKEIQSLADMTEARKWCSCMRLGIATWTDAQMWRALSELRASDEPIVAFL